jgi:DNA-directed RNA polymerase I subunit RPA12
MASKTSLCFFFNTIRDNGSILFSLFASFRGRKIRNMHRQQSTSYSLEYFFLSVLSRVSICFFQVETTDGPIKIVCPSAHSIAVLVTSYKQLILGTYMMENVIHNRSDEKFTPAYFRKIPEKIYENYIQFKTTHFLDLRDVPTCHSFPDQKRKLIHSLSIMVWPFCPNCRSTLKVDSTGDVECDVCSYRSNLSDMTEALPSTTTYSMDRPIPIWARSDEEQAALRQSNEPKRATIEETCTKCGAKEVGYYTVQLRSVDEGQTVFYECPDCKHTWSVNN